MRMLGPLLCGLGASVVSVPALAQAPRCRVAEVEVPAMNVTAGGRVQLLVIFRDAAGLPCDTDPTFTVASSNPAIARVAGDSVIGVAAGQTAILVRTTDSPPVAGAGVVVVAAAEIAVPPAPVVMVAEGPAKPPALVQPESHVAAASAPVAPAPAAPGAPSSAAVGRQPPGTAQPEMLTVTPAILALLPGEQAQLAYRFLGPGGVPALPQPLLFGAAGAVSVDSFGVVTAGIRPGAGTVTVRHATNPAPGLAAQVSVVVASDSVVFDRRAVSLEHGRTDTLRLTVPGQMRSLPLGSRLFTFASSDSLVAAVRPDAPIITARGTGRAVIRARHISGMGEVTATVTVGTPVARLDGPRDSVITVVAGAAAAFPVRALGSDGAAIPAPITWTVSRPVVALDSAAGRLRGVAAGTATVTAATQGLSGTVSRSWTVRVLSGAVELNPARIGLAPGSAASLAAWHRGTDERLAPGEVTWAVAGDAVMVAGGELRAAREGRARVTARAAWDSAAVADVFVVPALLLLLERDDRRALFAGDATAPAAREVAGEPLERRSFTWSPDRTRVAFTARGAGGRGPVELYVMDVDGGAVRRLTSDSAEVSSPSFVPPNGERIVFASSRGGRSSLFSIRVDGTDRQPIRTPREAAAPAVSPDGARLVYAGDGLYEIALDGTAERRVTTNGRDTAPRYTPDGRTLLFLRDEGVRTRRLFRLPAAGGAPAAMTPDGMQVDDFDINPAGTPLLCLVFSALGRSSVTPSLGFVGADGSFTRVTLGRNDEVLGCRFRP